jgi:hypothetical protein
MNTSTATDGVRIIANYCTDNGHSAIQASCRSAVVIANVCTYGTKFAFDMADLITIDLVNDVVVASNVLYGLRGTSGSVSVIKLFGTNDPSSVAIISNNVIRDCHSDWQRNGGYGCISVTSDVDDPEGVVVITGNSFSQCVGIDSTDAENTLIAFSNCAATFRAYVSGNYMQGDAANDITTAIRTTAMNASSVVRVGENYLDAFAAEYDDQSGVMLFSGSERVTSVLIDDTDSPYTLPPSVGRLLVDTNANPVTVNLPATAKMAGREVQIVDWGQNATANNITVAANGVETINGAASVAVATDGVTMNVYCYGGEYKTLSPVI